jgi:hypothetical protein
VSSGSPSALLALKIAEQYGAENVVAIFADANAEHADNYRFLYDLRQAGLEILYTTTGKSPNQLMLEQNTVFTNSLAPCTRILKLEPIRRYVQHVQRLGYVVHMHIGYTVEDARPTKDKPEGRITDTKRNWLLNWCSPQFGLVTEQYAKRIVASEMKQRGFIVPVTYEKGFENANCLEEGGCVRGGKGYMLRVLTHYPVAYGKRESTEQTIILRHYREQRAQGIRVADVKLYTQLRDGYSESGHISLKRFREQFEKAQRDMKQKKLFILDADGDLCGTECGVSKPEIWSVAA